MEKYRQKLEDFLPQLEQAPISDEVAAYDFRVTFDEAVNSLDLDVYALNESGQDIVIDGQEKLRVITSGYEELPASDLKEALEGVFSTLYADGHGHFDRPTYVTFTNDLTSYYVQGDEHVGVGARGKRKAP